MGQPGSWWPRAGVPVGGWPGFAPWADQVSEAGPCPSEAVTPPPIPSPTVAESLNAPKVKEKVAPPRPAPPRLAANPGNGHLPQPLDLLREP